MHCDQANALLIEYAEGTLSPADHAAVEACLATCEKCQADYEAIVQWRTMANNWHDEQPPAWNAPALARPSYLEQTLDGFRQWFPSLASATALVLVGVMYMGEPTSNGVLPSNGTVAADYQNLPQLPQATQAAFDSALQTNREQRRQELSSLLEIITAEMNRRSIETEDSLRFLVTSQVQGQQELDALYKQVEELLLEAQTAEGQPQARPGLTTTVPNEGVSQ